MLCALASNEPKLAALADALVLDDEELAQAELIAKRTACTVGDAARRIRRYNLTRALPRRGEEWAYECPSGAHSWLGSRGLEEERCPFCSAPPTRWQRPPELPPALF